MTAQALPTPPIDHPAPHRDRIGMVNLFFGIIAAPAAWSLQELLSAALTGHACFPGATSLTVPLWVGLRGELVTIDVVAIILVTAAILVSIRSWKRVRDERSGSGHQLLDVGEGRTRFMAMVGILSSSLFLVGVIFAAAGGLFLPTCL